MNNTSKTGHSPRPITARAAENGIYLSIFICVLLLLLGFGTQESLLAFFFLVGAVAMPFFAFSLLSRNCMRSGCFLSFSEIWAEGIVSFFLGSLLPAALCYCALRFAFPSFIPEQVQVTIDTLRQMNTPEMKAISATLENLRAEGLMPTPLDIAANIISINIVAGTAVSLIMAIVLSARIRMRSFRNRQTNQ